MNIHEEKYDAVLQVALYVVHDNALTKVEQLHMRQGIVRNRLIHFFVLLDAFPETRLDVPQTPSLVVGVKRVHRADAALDHLFVIANTFDKHNLHAHGTEAVTNHVAALLVAVVRIIHSHLSTLLKKLGNRVFVHLPRLVA